MTHRGSLALRNVAAKLCSKPGVGLELPEHETKQDRTGHGRTGQWHVRQQETAMSSQGHRFISIHILLVNRNSHILI